MFSDGEIQTVIVVGWDELMEQIEETIDIKKKAIKDTENAILNLECSLRTVEKMKEAAHEGKKVEVN